MDQTEAEDAVHVGRTIAEQAMKDLYAQTKIEEMSEAQQIVAAAAAAEEVFLLVTYLGRKQGNMNESISLASSYAKKGILMGLKRAEDV